MATALDLYMPYDTGAGANVTEDGWRRFAKHWRGDGVIRNYGSEMAVFGDSSGMQVKVPTGECWIQGAWGQITSTKILPIAAAHATLARRDLVVARNDFINNRIEVDVKTGTPAASPTYPTLTQNTSMWEIQLGKVQVAAAASGIAAGNVQALQTFVDGSCSYSVDLAFQSIPDNAPTRVDWDLELFPSSAVDRTGTNGLNAFTLRRAGQWLFVASVEWNVSTVGLRAAWVARTADGSSSGNRLGFSSIAPNVSGAKTIQNITATERFTANEEVALYVHQTSGGGLSLTKDFTSTRIQIYWLGP
ncbi:hypothetical protein [Amycolatopsis thermoflava]|uniref:hypothetical protein n=1 Tax=Amycolatopsis thermoflava TaxID=84480 RepID=UPI00040D83DA|nr:hypothetical protein [Amycolatopsis thermoflava]